MPQPDNLYPCPDCGAMVSRRAVNCPHCGAPLQAGIPVQCEIAELSYSWSNLLLGGGLFILGIFSVIKTPYSSGMLSVWIAGFFAMILGLALMKIRKLHCHRCGYRGIPRISGGPSGCIFLLLLCFGILPGILYLILVPEKKQCPRCGQEAS